jgi:hypothetical protein
MTHSQKRIEDGIVFLQRRPLNSMCPACLSLIGKLSNDVLVALDWKNSKKESRFLKAFP